MKTGNFQIGVGLVIYSLLPSFLLFVPFHMRASTPALLFRIVGFTSLAAYPLGLFVLWNTSNSRAQGAFLIILLGAGGLFFLLHLAVTVLLALGGGPSPG